MQHILEFDCKLQGNRVLKDAEQLAVLLYSAALPRMCILLLKSHPEGWNPPDQYGMQWQSTEIAASRSCSLLSLSPISALHPPLAPISSCSQGFQDQQDLWE